MLDSEECRHIHSRARLDEPLEQDVSAFTFGVGDGDLDVDIGTPCHDLQRLAFHLAEVVRENLERDRPVGYDLEDLTRERLVINDAGLSHQRRVGGEPRDTGVGGEPFDAGAVGAIGEDLHLHG